MKESMGIRPKKVLVAGASGFIGQALVDSLLKNEQIEIVALSRKERESSHARLKWVQCDLYSLKDLKAAMTGCDAAYYLVHSMLPSAALSQGKFYDFDLMLADNFSKSIEFHQVKQLIYLGGLMPSQMNELSWHLRSRLEVEQTLKIDSTNWIMLRAGLIIGKNGSSFTILKKLVDRLPIMILPAWTQNRMEPIALSDVVRILTRSLESETLFQKTFDIGGREKLTYRELILKTAKLLKKKTHTLNVNFIPIALSRFWVSLITQSPRSLVYPLILSLKHSMLVDQKRAWPYPEDIQVSIDESLKEAMKNGEGPRVSSHSAPEERDVRSIQRLSLPSGKNAEWIADEYFRWVPRFLWPFLKVTTDGQRLRFQLLGITLLILEKSLELSSPDRQLLYIKGGRLAHAGERGRLEFRVVLQQKNVMAAIHNYRPALPWFIYKLTQARIHLFVMKQFEKHLAHLTFLNKTTSEPNEHGPSKTV